MAFLIRLWRVDDQRHSTWRASIQDPHTGERRGFVDLKGLFAFLEEETSDRCQRTGLAAESESSDSQGDMPMN